MDDIDFADDLAIISCKHQHLQEKTSENIFERIGLKIHAGSTKLLGINTANDGPITQGGNGLEETFTKLGSIVNNHGGTDADVKTRIGKARVAFLQLKNIWSAMAIATRTKYRIFNSNVNSVLHMDQKHGGQPRKTQERSKPS